MAEHPEGIFSRSNSPSPSDSPDADPLTWRVFDRSVSASSTNTSVSCSSTAPDTSTTDPVVKRRGYTRPQATIFADSARNRDSVMSLGTIAHLQYYFARTGLLDGKGAQLAREKNESEEGFPEPPRPRHTVRLSSHNLRSLESGHSNLPGATPAFTASSEISHSSNASDSPEVLTLPPTHSTYKQKPHYVAPPPSISVLRQELQEALEDAKKVLEAQHNSPSEEQAEPLGGSSPARSHFSDDPSSTQGWHEIEGLHILDLITLAIRAAKNYYTSHDSPQRLYSICPERRIRADLYRVLEILKKVGARNFAGGYRAKEVQDILQWISDIETLVTSDEKAEQQEIQKRESWMWLNGNCDGHDREREWVFLKSFEPPSTALPMWSELLVTDSRPGPFLDALRDGIVLIQLHNELVKNSWRQWGEIKSWHTDTNKPYRRSENIRYWLKAGQLRWEVHLDMDVSGMVNDRSLDAWRSFDAAILKWSQAVRHELTVEWKEHQGAASDRSMLDIGSGKTAQTT